MSLREGGATLPSSVDHGSLPVRRPQLVEALAHDAHALAHLLHADDLAVVVVAVLAHGDVEIHLLVERVRLRLAQVPGHAAAADDRPREAPLPAIVQREDADIDVALLEDAVADDEGIEIVEHLQERIAERLDVVDQLRLDIHVDAAGPEVIGVHARAGNALIEDHQLLALLEAPERRRERADIHGLRGHVEEVREKTPDFGIEHPDQLGAAGHLDAEQLLDRHAIGVFLVHRRDVVEPVEIGVRLNVGLVLDQLLGAAMQQADMRIDALDDLAVQLQHEAQDAVRGRVLRAEIDGEVADIMLAHGSPFPLL